jgi:CelD/BcsL family acetyltransferase involved in cellulose biosynthesis
MITPPDISSPGSAAGTLRKSGTLITGTAIPETVIAVSPGPPDQLRLEKIDSPERLLAAKPIWDELLAACPHRTPFLTHEWVMNWWKHFGHGKEFLILIVYEASRPVLIAPLMKYRGPVHGGRVPVPAMIVETIANYHSNRADFIFERLRPEYFRLVWDHLRRREHWHLLRFYPIPDDSPTVSALRQCIEGDGVRAIFTHSQSSPYVPLTDREALRQQFPKDVSRVLRKAAREGKELKLEVTKEPARLSDALLTIFKISDKGWAAARGTAVSSTPVLRGFYGDMAREAAERGWLYLSLLNLDGRAIAYEYNFLYGNTVYALKCAFDGEFARWSPGKVLTQLVLSHLLAHEPQVAEYDALGDADSFKLLWGSSTRRHLKTYVYRPGSPYARLLYSLHAGSQYHPATRRKTVWRSAKGLLS